MKFTLWFKLSPSMEETSIIVSSGHCGINDNKKISLNPLPSWGKRLKMYYLLISK